MTTPIEILKISFSAQNRLLKTTAPSDWLETQEKWERLQKMELKEIKKAIDILEAIMQTGY